jgi:hypothetical protein
MKTVLGGRGNWMEKVVLDAKIIFPSPNFIKWRGASLQKSFFKLGPWPPNNFSLVILFCLWWIDQQSYRKITILIFIASY